MWHPYRYLIAGRPKWDDAWFDLTLIPDPEAWLTEKLGALAGFEAVTECRPLSNAEAMTFAHIYRSPVLEKLAGE